MGTLYISPHFHIVLPYTGLGREIVGLIWTALTSLERVRDEKLHIPYHNSPQPSPTVSEPEGHSAAVVVVTLLPVSVTVALFLEVVTVSEILVTSAFNCVSRVPSTEEVNLAIRFSEFSS